MHGTITDKRFGCIVQSVGHQSALCLVLDTFYVIYIIRIQSPEVCLDILSQL